MDLRFLGQRIQLPMLAMWSAEGAAALLAGRISGHYVAKLQASSEALWAVSAVFAACVVVAMLSMRLFTIRQRDSRAILLLRITIAIVGGACVATVILATWTRVQAATAVVCAATLLAWCFIVTIRGIGLHVIDENRFKRRILIYGTGRNALKMRRLRRRSDQRGFRLVGFVRPPGEECLVDEKQVLTSVSTLRECAMENSIDEIVVAMDDRRRSFPVQELMECRIAGIDVIEFISFLERETGKVHLDLLYPSWVIFGRGYRHDVTRSALERVFDLGSSAAILLVSWPAMLVIMLAIKLEDGWSAPILYRQLRVGYGGRLFHVLKFRSMCIDAEKDGAQWAAKRDNRVTRVGAAIRKARLDELPQLVNVFKGEMSFVGPRPERPEFVDQLSNSIPFYGQRHSVKPGITGWAQLCYNYGASEADAKEKLQYDLFYVKHHSLVFDLLILLQTVEVVFFGRGAR